MNTSNPWISKFLLIFSDGPYTNGFVENTHNTSSEHTDELPPYTDQDIGQELSDESDLDKPYDCRPMNDSK